MSTSSRTSRTPDPTAVAPTALTPRGSGERLLRRPAGAATAGFTLAYLLTWLVWGSRIAQDHGWLSWHIPSGLALWVMTVGTVTVAAVTGGKPAVRDLFARVLCWRVGARWYAAAVIVPLTIASLTVVLTVATRGDSAIGADIGLGGALGYLIFGVLLFTLTEELTWRGFILPRLQSGMSALAANLLLGLAWALWHTPAFFIADEQQNSYPYVGFVLFTMSAAVLTGWLYNRTGGSVLIAGLFHACCDATYFYTGLLHDHRLFWTGTAVSLAAATLVVAVEGPQSLAGSRPPSRYPVHS